MKQFALRKNNSHIPHSEFCGEDVIDWYAELEKVKPDTGQLFYLGSMAHSWVTCACGNACQIIPRSSKENDRPDDEKLAELGYKFALMFTEMEVCLSNQENFDKYRAEAIKTLDKIEARSAILVNRIMKKREKLPPVTIKERKAAL